MCTLGIVAKYSWLKPSGAIPKQYEAAVMLLIRNSQSLTARLGGEQFGSPPKQQRYFEEAISLSRACSFYLKQIHNFFFLSLSRKLVFLISNCWCFFFFFKYVILTWGACGIWNKRQKSALAFIIFSVLLSTYCGKGLCNMEEGSWEMRYCQSSWLVACSFLYQSAKQSPVSLNYPWKLTTECAEWTTGSPILL